jgi:hypothetical protein
MEVRTVAIKVLALRVAVDTDVWTETDRFASPNWP